MLTKRQPKNPQLHQTHPRKKTPTEQIGAENTAESSKDGENTTVKTKKETKTVKIKTVKIKTPAEETNTETKKEESKSKSPSKKKARSPSTKPKN